MPEDPAEKVLKNQVPSSNEPLVAGSAAANIATNTAAASSTTPIAAKPATTGTTAAPAVKKRSHKKALNIALDVALVLLILYVFSDFIGIKDFIRSSTFSPTSEVSDIIASLDLTDKGNFIMRASRPSLEESEDFNKNCESYNKEVYVLGCYNPTQSLMHLYNVTSDELNGVVESTAAHEFLHAAWARMPFWERQNLNEALSDVYNNLPENSDIRESMDLYGSSEFYDELHSRIGTQIADLPTALEEHYAAYFKDQDAVVEFFNSYNDVYKALEQKLADLEAEIDELDAEIEANTAHYNAWSEELNNKIAQFNSSADDLSASEFARQRAELQKEVDAVDAYWEELNTKIDRYNALVTEYNDSAINQNEFLDSMNSNSERPQPTENTTLTDPNFSI